MAARSRGEETGTSGTPTEQVVVYANCTATPSTPRHGVQQELVGELKNSAVRVPYRVHGSHSVPAPYPRMAVPDAVFQLRRKRVSAPASSKMHIHGGKHLACDHHVEAVTRWVNAQAWAAG